jgi:hypothetical protein
MALRYHTDFFYLTWDSEQAVFDDPNAELEEEMESFPVD